MTFKYSFYYTLFFIVFLISRTHLEAQQITSGRGQWLTLHTEHFQIHFEKEQRNYALETARMAEELHKTLEPLYKSEVTTTHISLVFETDTVNAFATSYGFDQIVLFLDQPTLGDFSRFHHWTRLLLEHEYTHILTIRYNRHRGNHFIRWLLGIPPAAISPYGLIEGSAVFQESKTNTGRLNDPLTEMMVRTALLENSYPGLGEMMNGTRRWPYGRAGYLYGGRIIDQLTRLHGKQALYDYWNSRALPINPNARLPRKTSLLDLYKTKKESDKEIFESQINAIQSRGETRFNRLTNDGNFKEFLTINDSGELLYFGKNMRSTPGLFRIKNDEQAAFERRQLSSGGYSEVGDKQIYSEDYLFFSDFGIRHEIYDAGSIFLDRVANNRSIKYPSISGDGKTIVFVERDNHRRYLKYASLNDSNEPIREKIIFEVPFDGIIQFTDISSDNKSILSIIRPGKDGFAGLYICSLQTNNCERHLETTGIITQPRFLKDGSDIVFSSDAGGIYNLYSYNPDTKKTVQLTRTLTGLFYPTPSASGQIYALRYFASGYDVVSMAKDDLIALESDLFLTRVESETNQNDQDGEKDELPLLNNPEETSYGGMLEFQPWLMSFIGPITNFNVGILASDPLFRHSFLAGIGASVPDPIAVAIYDYSRYKVGLNLHYSGNYWKRNHNPGCINEDSDPLRYLCDSPYVFQESAYSYIRIIDPGRYFSEQLLLGYAHTKIRNARRSRLVEYEQRDYNLSGPSMVLLMGDTQYYPMSISQERGWLLFLSTDYYTNPESKNNLEKNHYNKIDYGVAEGGMAFYLPSFWDHHVNYLNAYGYTSYGPQRETQKVRLNRFVRGLAYDKAPKNHAAAVVTYEYRLPFSLYSFQLFDRAPGSMLNNAGLSLFVDYGASFDRQIYREDWTLSYGINLSFSLNIAYLHLPDLKFTYARGTGVAGESQIYFSFNAGLDTGLTGAASGHNNHPITKLYHRSMPDFNGNAGYFRDRRAGGILE